MSKTTTKSNSPFDISRYNTSNEFTERKHNFPYQKPIMKTLRQTDEITVTELDEAVIGARRNTVFENLLTNRLNPRKELREIK
jgi:hypothetical protein